MNQSFLADAGCWLVLAPTTFAGGAMATTWIGYKPHNWIGEKQCLAVL